MSSIDAQLKPAQPAERIDPLTSQPIAALNSPRESWADMRKNGMEMAKKAFEAVTGSIVGGIVSATKWLGSMYQQARAAFTERATTNDAKAALALHEKVRSEGGPHVEVARLNAAASVALDALTKASLSQQLAAANATDLSQLSADARGTMVRGIANARAGVRAEMRAGIAAVAEAETTIAKLEDTLAKSTLSDQGKAFQTKIIHDLIADLKAQLPPDRSVGFPIQAGAEVAPEAASEFLGKFRAMVKPGADGRSPAQIIHAKVAEALEMDVFTRRLDQYVGHVSARVEALAELVKHGGAAEDASKFAAKGSATLTVVMGRLDAMLSEYASLNDRPDLTAAKQVLTDAEKLVTMADVSIQIMERTVNGVAQIVPPPGSGSMAASVAQAARAGLISRGEGIATQMAQAALVNGEAAIQKAAADSTVLLGMSSTPGGDLAKIQAITKRAMASANWAQGRFASWRDGLTEERAKAIEKAMGADLSEMNNVLSSTAASVEEKRAALAAFEEKMTARFGRMNAHSEVRQGHKEKVALDAAAARKERRLRDAASKLNVDADALREFLAAQAARSAQARAQAAAAVVPPAPTPAEEYKPKGANDPRVVTLTRPGGINPEEGFNG